jgi:peptidoglycan/LPS O-acetylase OafA/YrhL
VIVWTPFAKSPLFQFFLQNLIFAPAIATALIFLCRYQTSWGRLFSHPALLVAGEISYSVYLLQIIAFLPFRGAFNVGPQDDSLAGLANGSLRLAFMLGAASMLGYGSYWLIERPARDYLRARLSSDARARDRREANDASLSGTPAAAPQLARPQSAG